MKAYRAKTRTRVDQRGRSTNEFADARMRAGSKPPEGSGFIWLTADLLQSAAMRSLGINERRVVDRVIVEHLAHGGQRNGLLIVTHDDFEAFGVRRDSIAKAIANTERAGLIVTTFKDQRTRCRRLPSTFALTWLPWWKPNRSEDSQAEPTFHDRRETWAPPPPKKQNATPQSGGDVTPQSGGDSAPFTPQSGGETAFSFTPQSGGALYILGGGASDDARPVGAVGGLSRTAADAELVKMLGAGSAEVGRRRATLIDPGRLACWASHIAANTLTAAHKAEIAAAAKTNPPLQKERAS